GRPGSLPHGWQVTSDSLAVRVAVVLQARRLILLKSIPIPQETDWSEAGRRGWVDEYFAEALRSQPGLGPGFEVRAVNFREGRPLAGSSQA
ncbi:MAG: hypothetical protein JO112_12340, partial [Planctomycetes bacterium]|nr:hypothetical protein [Planctomycetota bacterium]